MHIDLVNLGSNEILRETMSRTDPHSRRSRQPTLPRLDDATFAIGDAAGSSRGNNSIPTDDSPVSQSRSTMPSPAGIRAYQGDGAVREALIKRIHDLNMRRPVK